MGLFRKKKKTPLFGGSVEPSCAYCRHNGGRGEPVCTLRLQPQGEACKRYEYDPLLREPKNAPPLRTSQFSPEDFQL